MFSNSNCISFNLRYNPFCAISCLCVPISLTIPLSITTILSALRTVESRWAITKDVRPSIRFSNASCTTNGLAPVAKVLNDAFGIDKGMLTTVHAYTNSQKLQDVGAKDLRDARAAAQNIVPSATGAAKAVGLVIPELKGKFGGMAFRVPTPTVSVVDFTAVLNKEASKEEVRDAMLEYAAGPMKDILGVTDEPLVSTDLRGTNYSSVFSSMDTLVIGNMVKVVAWYDNEWGYACRTADLTAMVAKSL